MPLSELAVSHRVVGVRQVWQKLRKASLQKLFVAEDAEARIVSGLVEEAEKLGIAVERVASMKTLGRACAIDRGAAAAGISQNEDGHLRRPL
ncbi:MAG TPA: ribosomal L7Ae/L30e/S12e/Gadd45 family protein [Synergistaceae bacterium]|nr:ribosomal L7Ae/L30e/S12e/Gadd45 family protein [Synergistaceae bacterium]HQK24736.1 ribosomal L7Ae/L30e/S12e/Gadd45 family protein [Synergistaceae bacterium]